MLERDIPKVAEIEKEIFSIPWSEKAFLDSLKSDNTIYMVAVSEEKVVGYCGMYLYTPEANITNVAVDKQYRRKHVAEQLVNNIIKKAKELSLYTVLRYFLLDSMAYENILTQQHTVRPDFIEVLPGAMPKVIQKLCSEIKVPVIAGGLIIDKESVMGALTAGATAVSSTNHNVWKL